MSTIGWRAQAFAAEGSAAAEGISRQLGKPDLDPLTILVREAAQNSWDARRGDGPVSFEIDLSPLSSKPPQLSEELEPRTSGEFRDNALRALSSDSYVITVSDRRTRGLSGPLRADVRAPSGVSSNFVQFLRNVGEPRDQSLGGGTYGFGKGIFYSLSRAGAILVDTAVADQLGPQRRLMGAAMSHSFYEGDRRYTGRHWWGVLDGEIVMPLEDDAASARSSAFGFRGFENGETGTDVVILGADLGSVDSEDGESRRRTPREAAEFIASSMLWHLWPKMGSRSREADMQFAVTVDGARVEIPTPFDVPELRPFVAALDELHSIGGKVLRRSREPRSVGALALQQTTADPASFYGTDSLVEAARPFRPPLRHVARMRQVELVVDYYEADPHPDPLFGFTGVFKASKAADGHFAMSEPPTHDAWVETGLHGTDLGVVRGARQFIRSSVSQQFAAPAPQASAAAGLGNFASKLSGLSRASSIGAGSLGRRVTTSGADNDGRSGGPSAPRPRGRTTTRSTVVYGPSIEQHPDGALVVAEVRVPAADNGRRLTLTPVVVLEGGAKERDAPHGSTPLEVVGWWTPGNADWLSRGATLETSPAEDEARVRVAVKHVPDVVIAFELQESER